MNGVLNADRVREILLDCRFKKEDSTPNYIFVEGIISEAKFNIERLSTHRVEIDSMLDELSDDFKRPQGASFLIACLDKDGEQWGDHPDMEELFLLGMATGKARMTLPRGEWTKLPGGVPFYIVN